MVQTRRYPYQQSGPAPQRQASVKEATYEGFADIAEDVYSGIKQGIKLSKEEDDAYAKFVEQTIRGERNNRGLQYKFQTPWHKDLQNYKKIGVGHFNEKHGTQLTKKQFSRVLNYIAKNSAGEDRSKLKEAAIKAVSAQGLVGKGIVTKGEEGFNVQYNTESTFAKAFETVTGTKAIYSFSSAELDRLESKSAGLGLFQNLVQAVKRQGMGLEEAQTLLTNNAKVFKINPTDLVKYRDQLDESYVERLSFYEKKNTFEQKRADEKFTRGLVQKAVADAGLSPARSETVANRLVREKVSNGAQSLRNGQIYFTEFKTAADRLYSARGTSPRMKDLIQEKVTEEERRLYQSIFRPKPFTQLGFRTEPYYPAKPYTRKFAQALYVEASKNLPGFRESTDPEGKRALLDNALGDIDIGGVKYDTVHDFVEAMDEKIDVYSKAGGTPKTLARMVFSQDAKAIEAYNERLAKTLKENKPPEKRVEKPVRENYVLQRDPVKNRENAVSIEKRIKDILRGR